MLRVLSSEKALNHDQQLCSVYLTTCFCDSISIALLPDCRIFHLKQRLRKQYTRNKLHQHLLSTWLIPLGRWRCKAFHTLLCCVPLEPTACLHKPYSFLPLPWLSSLSEISRSQSDQTAKTHFFPSRPIWMHNVTAAVVELLSCKSEAGDLIKRAWPPRWGGWMGPAPLSSQMPSVFDFNAPTVCSQDQCLSEKSLNGWSTLLRKSDLLAELTF